MNFLKKNILPILLIIISIFTFYRLIRPGYFSMQDDIQVFRLEQFDQCIKDGQIPCRYIPNGGLGYGYPLYNYYSPLPYAIAEGFHLIGFSYISSIKIVFSFAHIIGAIGMYLFASLFWGKTGGFISAILFLFAPYQAVDSYVRGAIAESFALNLIPLIFWSLTLLIKENKKQLLFIFSLAALLTCHNLTTLTFTPILGIYTLIVLYQNKKFNLKNLFKIIVSGLISVGIGAFFLLPIIFENKFVTVNTMTQGFFYYVIHFATLSELFISRFWGYGGTTWGPKDNMSFQIGYIHWTLPIIVLIFFFLKKFKTEKKNTFLIVFFFIVFVFSAFLSHSKSTPIWQAFSFMPFYQFPWRFLMSIVFSLSFIGGAIILIFNNSKIKIAITIALTVSVIVLNLNYFKEDIWYNITDQDKLSNSEIIRQSGAGLMDYWPNYGTNFPQTYSAQQPYSEVKIETTNFVKKSNQVKANINTEQDTQITMPVVYFPNWQLKIDNNPSEYVITKDLGLIQFDLKAGNHTIELNFKNTLIRIIGNIISILSVILAIIFFRPKHLNQ